MLLYLVGALIIGLSLGLLGSGGSILTVPILHYGLDWSEKLSVAGSLFIVGSISLIASVPQMFLRRVDWRSVALFGIPGVFGTKAGAYLSRWVPGPAQLGLFAGVMLLAAYFLRRKVQPQPEGQLLRAPLKVAGDGLLVGAVTGLVGVGGGFMIVPALVLLGGLEMLTAVGTSLVIIAANSLAGFSEHQSVLREMQLELDWHVLWIFVSLGTAGSLVGSKLGRSVPRERLKAAFSIVLVVVAVGILISQALVQVGPAEPPEPPGAQARSIQSDPIPDLH